MDAERRRETRMFSVSYEVDNYNRQQIDGNTIVNLLLGCFVCLTIL